MKLTIYTDGGSLNNPGQAASAFLIHQDNKLLTKKAVRLGVATNNVAEYTALVLALEEVKKLLLEKKTKPEKITCFSDSSLMVNQVNGLFKIKNPVMREMVMKIRILEQEIKIPIIYKYVPREKNTEADFLVEQALTLVS